MKGSVLAYDSKADFGEITGNDDKRYKFSSSDWKSKGYRPKFGMQVDFEANKKTATEIYKDPSILGLASSQSEKSFAITFLLCLFVGFFAVHRFYTGKIGTGIIFIFTLGGLGIWWIVDYYMIIFGAFRDRDGLYVRHQIRM